MNTTNQLSMVGWNVKCGGFADYSPGHATPEREQAILDHLSMLRERDGTEATTIVDAYRWHDYYGGNQGIADHLDYASALFVPLDDERLNRKHGAGIGLAFATDHPVAESGPLDLDTRQGLRTVLDTGKYGLQVVVAYLDDLSEDVRQKQAAALLANMYPEMPSLVVGDLNTLRPNTTGVGQFNNERERATRLLAKTLFKPQTIGAQIADMDRARTIPALLRGGLVDADSERRRPTAPSRLPLIGLDYVLHSSNVRVPRLDIDHNPRASDHGSLSFTAQYA